MSTPSIQTLITQAQQVLNLKSSNEIRATLAAVLANANVGTPLNPNLTTQQLWDEFYEIVRQPSDDIMSIITDQMMRMVFSPPAPGGAGADKQVIFNDGGVLAGDTKFLWDKNANQLDVDGPVVITGNLTVDTNVLKVDTTNNRVSINTTTFATDSAFAVKTTAGKFDVRATGSLSIKLNSDQSMLYNVPTGNSHLFQINDSDAMTLNSTGLGIGVSPGSAIGNLQVGGSTNANLYAQQGTDTIRIGVRASGRTGIILDSSNATYTNRAWYLDNAGSSGSLTIGRQGLDVITFDNVGNVGIGVTPSAWQTGLKTLQFAANGVLYANGTNSSFFGNNYFTNSAGDNKYLLTYAATAYGQVAGAHQWFNAPSGTAGNTITFTQAMTLDASGNLLVGKTSASLTPVGVIAQGNGATVSTLAGSTDATETSIVYSNGANAYRFYVGMAGTVYATNVVISAISDARYKENVQDIDVGLAAILSLKPRKFDWKAGKGKDIKGDRGFIAQEFETVFPNLIDEWKDPAPEGEAPYKSVRQDLIPVLVKAIQELTARVQTLEAR